MMNEKLEKVMKKIFPPTPGEIQHYTHILTLMENKTITKKGENMYTTKILKGLPPVEEMSNSELEIRYDADSITFKQFKEKIEQVENPIQKEAMFKTTCELEERLLLFSNELHRRGINHH